MMKPAPSFCDRGVNTFWIGLVAGAIESPGGVRASCVYGREESSGAVAPKKRGIAELCGVAHRVAREI